MRLPRLVPATALLAVGAVLATASAAAAAPLTAYEMPFPCGQTWTGTSRPSHSPSPWSIDWNRTDDVGDPVVAAAAGVVTTAVPNGTRGYGRYVVVDHGNGESTLYGHLQTVNVGIGQTVDQGSLVGLVGDTGNSTGPHLHFEERLNGKTVEPWFHGAAFAFGSTPQSQNCPDVPMAGNFVGDGIAEVAVFDRATATFQISGPAGPISVVFGLPTDTPVVGDWDGDGVLNVGVRRASERKFYLGTPSGIVPIVMGNRSDIPVAGDWDGNGTWEPGVRKSSSNVFRLRKPDGKSFPVRLGKAGDIPISGDWNGDGTTDLGVYDITRARFSLRVKDAAGLVWITRVTYGSPGDLPVTGDWDGNGRTDLGVWQPATAQFFQRIAPSPAAPATKTVSRTYGTPRR
ncbi:MAG TPA: M23 family metallopeptidase [Nocardioides sp.]|nr:M23 family metallopeptidase [Nocardioides sp.]